MDIEKYAVNYREVRDLLNITTNEAKMLVAVAVGAEQVSDVTTKTQTEVNRIGYRRRSVDERYHKKRLLPIVIADLEKNGLPLTMKQEICEDDRCVKKIGFVGRYATFAKFANKENVTALIHKLARIHAFNYGNETPPYIEYENKYSK